MSRWVKFLIAFIIVLIAVRLYLPVWATKYVNRVLADVPGYYGSIEDLDIALYRGAYKLNQLKMLKIGEETSEPFLEVDLVDLSIEWKSLLRGELVGEIELIHPVISFVAPLSDSEEGADWTIPIKALMPLQINRFAVTEGTIKYIDHQSNPPVDISLEQLTMEASNLSNAEHRDRNLPSSINIYATSIGGGKLNAVGQANLLREIPDFDLDLEFEGVSLPALNDFTQAYSNLDFEAGIFNVYMELAVADGQIEGYVKPIITDLKVSNAVEVRKKPLKAVWGAVAGLLFKVFENPKEDQFATKVPLSGDLNNTKTKIWPAIINILKNAFIEAFEKDTDNEISFQDLIQ